MLAYSYPQGFGATNSALTSAIQTLSMLASYFSVIGAEEFDVVSSNEAADKNPSVGNIYVNGDNSIVATSPVTVAALTSALAAAGLPLDNEAIPADLPQRLTNAGLTMNRYLGLYYEITGRITQALGVLAQRAAAANIPVAPVATTIAAMPAPHIVYANTSSKLFANLTDNQKKYVMAGGFGVVLAVGIGIAIHRQRH